MGRREVDGPRPPRANHVFLDEATMVLCSWCSVHSSPALLTVVAQAVDVATEIGSIESGTVDLMAHITHRICYQIWLNFNIGFYVSTCDQQEMAEPLKHL